MSLEKLTGRKLCFAEKLKHLARIVRSIMLFATNHRHQDRQEKPQTTVASIDKNDGALNMGVLGNSFQSWNGLPAT
jgi:hypothetical protein